MNNDADFAPGTFGCHEALHMAHVLAELVEMRLCEHPAIQANAHWQERAATAAAALHELYQAIGRAHLPPDSVEG
jgi:hypothetical protein